MTDTETDPAANRGYHAHIYYDAATRPLAERLCRELGRQFPVAFGGFRDGPVGPHPIANAQVIFTPAQFGSLVPWLMLNRQGLDVLVHPLTDDSVADHSRYALWLGTPVPLKLDALRRNYRAELLPAEARTA
jgi:aromatic ring-cleaving dioxygenase